MGLRVGTLLAHGPGEPSEPDTRVDLTSVTFIDQARRYLLQLMHRDGARFVASDLMLQDLWDHVTGMKE